MNLTEILNRDVKQSFHINEYEAVIKEYIYKRKGINVEVNLEKTYGLLPNEFHLALLHNNLPHIIKMFDKASKYLREN